MARHRERVTVMPPVPRRTQSQTTSLAEDLKGLIAALRRDGSATATWMALAGEGLITKMLSCKPEEKSSWFVAVGDWQRKAFDTLAPAKSSPVR